MNIDDIATGFAKINQMRDRIAALEAENERLRRMVEFVKSENSADTTGCGIGFCMLCFCSHSKDEPHLPDCPHNEANQ